MLIWVALAFYAAHPPNSWALGVYYIRDYLHWLLSCEICHQTRYR